MTISNTKAKSVYEANGERREWELGFDFDSNVSKLNIILEDREGYQYLIEDNYLIEDGVVVYPSLESELDPVAEGYKIILIRETVNNQDIDFRDNLVEQGLDKLTLQMQEIAEEVDRAIKVPVSEEGLNKYKNPVLEIREETKKSLNEIKEATSIVEDYTKVSSSNAVTSKEEADRAVEASNVSVMASSDAEAFATKAENLANEAHNAVSAYVNGLGAMRNAVLDLGVFEDNQRRASSSIIDFDFEPLDVFVRFSDSEKKMWIKGSHSFAGIEKVGDKKYKIFYSVSSEDFSSQSAIKGPFHVQYVIKYSIFSGKPVVYRGRVDTVEELPEEAEDGDLWYVGTVDTENKKEYIWQDGKFELVGSTSREDYETLHNDLDELGDQVAEIESKIPAEASYSNQLADKKYVNEAILASGGSGGSVVIETEITEDSTDATVPSSKAVWDKVNVLEDRFVEGNPDYVVEGTGNLATIGGRAFAKKNDGLAYGMVYSNGSYKGCILVSEIPEAVIINPPSYAAEGSFEYAGRTWYYSPDEYFMPNSNNVTLGLLKVIKTDTPFSTPLEAARYVIENGLNYKVNGLVTDVTNVKEDVSKLANAYTSSNLKAGTNIALTKAGYHKILSNFSSSRYVKFIKNFNPTNSYRMIVGLTTGSDVKTTQSILSVQGVDRNFYLKGSGSVFSYYPGSSVAGKTVATAKTDYWLVFDYDGTTCKLYLAKDDGTYVSPKDLPALTDSFWTEELSYTTEIFKGKNLQLGKNGSTTAYWFGSINLGKVLITADGDEWFNGLTAEEGIDYTNLGCTVTNERVEGLEVATTIDCVIEKLSQLEDDLGVYTKTNLLAGKNIEIIPEPVEGGIDEYTMACWHFDGNNVDEVNGYTIGSQTKTDYYKFGSASLRPYGTSSTFNFSSEKSYTIDFWFLFSSKSNTYCSIGFPELMVQMYSGKELNIRGSYLSKVATFTLSTNMSNDVWYHIALTYENHKATVFLNGKKIGETETLSTQITSGETFGIQQANGADYMRVDELRVSDIVRYTEDFTPQEEPYRKAEPTGKYVLNNLVTKTSQLENDSGFLTSTEGAGGNGKNIGEVYYSQSSLATDNAGALPLFTGETIASANTIYPDFYKWISERAELQINSDKYEEALANFGECPKYVLDIASTEETNSYKYTFPTTVPDTWVLAYLDNGEYVEFEENGVYYSPVKFAYNTSERSTNELYYDEGLTKRIFARDTSVSESWLPVSAFTMAASSDTNGWIALLGYFKDGFYTDFHDSTTLNSTTTIPSTATPEESVVTRTTYTRDGSLRLPKLTNYVKMANTTDGITQGEAGLPNITGELGSTVGVNVSSGAFTTVTNGNHGQGGSGIVWKGVFDASRSSEVYGKSDTVTPAHTTLFPWVYAYNASIPASVAQAAEFQEGLSGKADTNLGNVTEEGKENAVAWGRNFVNVNKTVVKGSNAGTIGTYELGFTDSKVKIGVFNLGFNTTSSGHSNMGIKTDVVSNIVYIGGTNNGYATTNTVTIPFINSVTLTSTNTTGGISNNSLVLVGYFE